MVDADGLVCAFILDGEGGGQALGWDEIENTPVDGKVIWIHLDRGGARAHDWIAHRAGLPPLVAEALLAEESRPRAETFDGGLMVNLRGVNLNPGEEPEDMVSIRVWVEAGRVISVRRRRLMAVDDIRAALAAKHGPKTPPGLLIALASGLVSRMEPVIADLSDRIDGLEDELLDGQNYEQRGKLAHIRREGIAFRRYIAPLREAMSRLSTDSPDWFTRHDRLRLRELTDRVMRYVEDLDEVRERASVISDELSNMLSERMNRTMYILSIVATVFLPLGLLTGLLGINVGGIPGAQTQWAFGAVTLGLVVLAVVEVVLFRRLRML